MSWIDSNSVDKALSFLGTQNGDTYLVNEGCLEILECILFKLVTEDCALTYRRSIGIAQNVRKDLIPLLVHVKDNTKISDATRIIDTTIKILMILTLPVDLLISNEQEFRRPTSDAIENHILLEMGHFLTFSKEAFTDNKSTKAVVDHIKFFLECQNPLNCQQCDSINNCLALLGNILHIPEPRTNSQMMLQNSSMQNQIIWNLFTQSIDKILLVLIESPQNIYWLVTIVKLLSLIYKEQHVGTLQRLLNMWLESGTESSEDNESNTSLPGQRSNESSQINSDPTSDSSDTGRHMISKTQQTNSITEKNLKIIAIQNWNKNFASIKRHSNCSSTEMESGSSGIFSMDQNSSSDRRNSDSTESHYSQQFPEQLSDFKDGSKLDQNTSSGINSKIPKAQALCFSSDILSDCGYSTQAENQECISTSSNEDDQPMTKPVHHKPHHLHKPRFNQNSKRSNATPVDERELRRKKLVRRSKTNSIRMKGLIHHLPTNEDISNILKEFTVDFLLKGFGIMVRDIYTQILTTSANVSIDSSHFFWLVSFFLKFAVQLELDPEHISSVLSYEVISYFIFQGVVVYEQLENAPESLVEPFLRKLHLIVAAIKEFIQDLAAYQKLTHISDEDRSLLASLQKRVCQTEELKSLFILLIRQYKTSFQNKHYLQDLIVTNHHLLLFLDNSSAKEDDITQYLKEFATVDVMKPYGMLLEDFNENGELVNNCIFTMMHHIAGDLKNIPMLFQPKILKTFSLIWNSDYEICDDWSDLIEYVIQKFIHAPTRNFHYSNLLNPLIPEHSVEDDTLSQDEGMCVSRCAEWAKIKNANLLIDHYSQKSGLGCVVVKDIAKKYVENGMQNKTQITVIKELLEQNIIDLKQYEEFMSSNVQCTEERHEIFGEESFVKDVKQLVEYFDRDNKNQSLKWLQKILLDVCVAKLAAINPEKFQNCTSTLEPCIYYFTHLNLPIPLVTWTAEQFDITKQPHFIILLQKLGFLLPENGTSMCTFIRIPHYWSVQHLYRVAQQLGPIEQGLLNFDISRIIEDVYPQSVIEPCFAVPEYHNPINLIKGSRGVNFSPVVSNIAQRCSFLPLFFPIPTEKETQNTNFLPELKMDFSAEEMDCSSPIRCSPIQKSSQMKEQDTTSGNNIVEIGIGKMIEAQIKGKNNVDTKSVMSDLTRMCVSDEESQ